MREHRARGHRRPRPPAPRPRRAAPRRGADGRAAASGQPQSGLWFGNVDDLWSFGKPSGWGSVWKRTRVAAGETSDPFLMTGFDGKTLHLAQDGGSGLTVDVEVDFLGDGSWRPYASVDVPAGGYAHHVFPAGYGAHWVRVRARQAAVATATFVYD